MDNGVRRTAKELCLFVWLLAYILTRGGEEGGEGTGGDLPGLIAIGSTMTCGLGGEEDDDRLVLLRHPPLPWLEMERQMEKEKEKETEKENEEEALSRHESRNDDE